MTETNIVRIRRFAGRSTLAEAAAIASAVLDSRDVCFASAPGAWVAITVGESLTDSLADDVFESRWFGANGEARWIRDGESGAVAVLIVGDDAPSPTSLRQVDERDFGILERRYACWPVLSANDDGTLLLKDGRTPIVRIPISPGAMGVAGDALLIAWELLDDVGHGNIRVVDQLLRGIDRRDKGGQ